MALLPRPDLIIFDCDGVLVDSEPISGAVLVQLLRENGLNFTFEQMQEQFLGRALKQCIEIGERLLGHPLPDSFAATYRSRRDEALRTQLKPTPGIKEALARLPVPFCVASNGEHAKMQLTLRVVDLWQLVDGRIFSVADVEHPKPAPDLFLHAAAAMKARPSACVVVEDSALGVQAGVNAGMQVIGFARETPAHKLLDAGAVATILDMGELWNVMQLSE